MAAASTGSSATTRLTQSRHPSYDSIPPTPSPHMPHPAPHLNSASTSARQDPDATSNNNSPNSSAFPRLRLAGKGKRAQRDEAVDGPDQPWWKVAYSLENKGSVARDHLASERTYLAWLRTSLSLASIGIGQSRFRLAPLLFFLLRNRSSFALSTLSLHYHSHHTTIPTAFFSLSRAGPPTGCHAHARAASQ